MDQSLKRQDAFGTYVTTVYSALLREIQTKVKYARFKKVERGHFAVNG